MRYLIELEVMNPDTSVVEVLTFTSGGQMMPFLPSDLDRPNVWYDPRIVDINGVNAHMFSRGKTQGESTLGSGVITLSNYDGKLDYLLDYGYSGRKIDIYSGEGNRFSDYTLYFSGIIETIEFSYSKNSSGSLEITIRSKKKIFDKDIQTNYYLGTNSGANGDEGLPENSIKDTLKPLCFGKCLNISPVLVNSSAHRYQIHDGRINSVLAVYSNGSELSESLTFPPPQGFYYADLLTGIITLGTAPTGDEQITCDVEGAVFTDFYVSGISTPNTYSATVAGIILGIVLNYAKLPATEIELADFDLLNSDAPQTVGIFLKDIKKPDKLGKTDSIASFLDKLVISVGAYWMFNTSSKLTVGAFKPPKSETTSLVVSEDNSVIIDETTTNIIDEVIPTSGTPIGSISLNEIIDIELIKSSDEGSGIPLFNITLQGVKNWTVQTKVAGVVTEDRKEWLKNEYRTFSVTNSHNSFVYNAEDAKMVLETLLTESNEASYEVYRRMRLYREKRLVFRLTVDRKVLPLNLDLGQVLTIIYPRFGLDSGKDFIILGIAFNYPKLNLVELEVWG